MTIEEQLINKSYYQTFMDGVQNVHPIKVLGEMYLSEHKSDIPELSAIRFAQGEVYYLNDDYESAILKWENVSNELQPWAQKNLGDAHFELGLLAIAEDYYKAVETDSMELKSEILLQLFSLYIQLDQSDKAMDTIKKAVELNPDDPDVTDIARAFFEEREEWKEAIHLAVNEALRTESLHWFEIIEGYAGAGHTIAFEPHYFTEVLKTLYSIQLARFESLTAALWKSYQQTDFYFSWLMEMNKWLMNMEKGQNHMWRTLSPLYKESFLKLMDGTYFIKDLSPLLPNYLTNWIHLSTHSDDLFAGSAVLAWNEMFPEDIDDSVVRRAEHRVSESPDYENVLDECLKLFETLLNWARDKGVALDARAENLVRQLTDLNEHRLMIWGTSVDGRRTVFNRLLQQELIGEPTSATVFVRGAEDTNIQIITEDKVQRMENLEDVQQQVQNQKAMVDFQVPAPFLNTHHLAVIYPGTANHKEMLPYLQAADSLLFTINVDSPLTPEELDMAVTLAEEVPELTIHFLLLSEQVHRIHHQEMKTNTISRIHTYFPNARILSDFSQETGVEEISSFIRMITHEANRKEKRTRKLLHFVKQTITYMLDQRVEMESSLMDEMKWNNETRAKINDALKKVNHLEDTKIKNMKDSYRKMKENIRQKLESRIPEILRNSSDIVDEDSDFEQIHDEVNAEMNKRVGKYVKDEILPSFHKDLHGWIKDNEEEFKNLQGDLDGLSGDLNRQFTEHKISLNGDFKILQDWKRDVHRMTRGSLQIENRNILKSTTSSQILWKGAGKLFDVIRQDKEKLEAKLKNSIERKDYSETVKSISNEFMQQFELFEHSLEWDVGTFFIQPYEVLNETLTETQELIERTNEELNHMRKNPETYRDPLTLFKLRVLQFEWMTNRSYQRNSKP
ncbi:tetratricopeptide repeat protein [Virgibacillus sp. MSP4-1]|uniref:tetratricopeptide repeat protein n=1 Tax=Virgibacillus sp. MSP4-1 TaxID=2700081 RepID=UPI0003A904EC|nr:tetratricopeptide repeat protein [Virgibacillus sp. MSP4-1]